MRRQAEHDDRYVRIAELAEQRDRREAELASVGGTPRLGALMDAEARCRACDLRFQLVCGATLERLLDVMGAREQFRELVMQPDNAPVSG